MSRHRQEYERDTSKDQLLTFFIGSAVVLTIILLIIAGIMIGVA